MQSDSDLYAARIKRALALVSSLDVAGILFFDLKNIRYLVGFTGSEGALLVTSAGAELFVDGRYQTQAEGQVSGARVVLCRDKVEGINNLLAAGNCPRVAFEAGALSHDLYLKIREGNEAVDFLALRSTDLAGLRAIKDDSEIGRIRTAAALATRAFQATLPLIRPGVKEREIALELDFQMRKNGAEDVAFQTIVASGANSAMPHARPTDRVIEKGDALVIDWGAVYEGYRSDETCTLMVGRAAADFVDAYRLVKEAHDLALSAIRAGVSTAEVDRCARERIEKGGMGDLFSHGTGHGVGLDVHENPRLAANTTGILEAGMVVTVEPGVYLPGRFGIRIEDLVLVRDGDCSVISGVDKKLIELE